MAQDLVSLLGRPVEDIASGAMCDTAGMVPKIEQIEDRVYVSFKQAGIAVVASLDAKVSVIQLHAQGHEGYQGFGGPLPEGLDFRLSRRDVRKRLGKATAMGGGEVIEFYGKVPAWDRYDRQRYSLHIQYVEGESAVDLLSLSRPDAVPR